MEKMKLQIELNKSIAEMNKSETEKINADIQKKYFGDTELKSN